jgi:hypothetical protein
MVEPASVIILIFSFAIGVFFLAKSMLARRYGRLAVMWPTATAVVLISDIEEDANRNATGKVSVGYLVKVEYEYKVNGQEYSGSRVTVGRPVFDYLDASNYKEQFKPGSQVPVYYNPKNPTEALLAPRSKVGLLSPVPGIFFVAVSALVAIFVFIVP